MLYEGLFRASEQGPLEYGLCKTMTVSSDKKTYLFTLKKTFWSDGSLVTAYDFEQAWLQQLHPETVSPYSYLFYPIKNAKNYKNKLCCKNDVGIKALKDDLLQIELSSLRDDICDLLSFSCFYPYKLKDNKPLFNGPFKLILHKLHERLELEKNLYYHNHQDVAIDKLTIFILDSEATALALFKQNQLDIIGGPLSSIPEEELTKHPPCYSQAMAGSTVCAFNTQSKYFLNLNLRKAFAYAIDYDALHKVQHNTTSFIKFLPLIEPLKKQVLTTSWQQKQAQDYLNKALQELQIDKKVLNNLCYYFGSKQEHAKIAQLLHSFWQTNLGINVKLAKLEHKTLATKINNKDFDFAQVVWLFSYNSPLALLDRFKEATVAKNFSSFQHPELSILIQRLENGCQNKDHILCQIEDLFAQHLPFVPLQNWQYAYFVSPKIKKLCFTNLGTINFTFIKINKDTCSLPPSSGI